MKSLLGLTLIMSFFLGSVSFARNSNSLNNETIESLRDILKPEVVDDLYAFKAQMENREKLNGEITHIGAAVLAGAAGGAAGAVAARLVDRAFRDRSEVEALKNLDATLFDYSLR